MTDHIIDTGDRIYDCSLCEYSVHQSEEENINSRDDMRERAKQHLRADHKQEIRNEFEKVESNARGNTFEGFLGSWAGDASILRNHPSN